MATTNNQKPISSNDVLKYLNDIRNDNDYNYVRLQNKGPNRNCSCITSENSRYWMNASPAMLHRDWYIALCDRNGNRAIHMFKIPADTFTNADDFSIRNDQNHRGELNIDLTYSNGEYQDGHNKNFVLSENNDGYPHWEIPILNQGCDIEAESDVKQQFKNSDLNVIFYGIPGCGKSYLVDEQLEGQDIERIVFHPDYSYSDFVGQIIPSLEQGKVVYKFNPGPFTRILGDALKDEKHMHYLVIEELNRGNAPAIFGDLFQLLDREENHQSRYCVTNADIQKWLFDEYGISINEIRIPANLSIYATMNTSDQNVFPLDTAFQRRWTMRYVPDDINECKWSQSHIGGPSSNEMTWKEFHDMINDIIKNDDSIITTEDKRLGAYFCSKEEIENAELFSNKVLKYLWDDAFKLRRNEVFDEKIKSFEDIDNSIKANSNSDKKLLDGILTILR